MKELDIKARAENLEEVIQFVDQELEIADCPIKAQMQIEIAVEEIFINIANYAYNPDTGSAVIRIEVTDDPVSVKLVFIDNGVPYDPLAKEDPDVTLSADKRDIGGLGVFLAKQVMDEIDYERTDGQNILTLIF